MQLSHAVPPELLAPNVAARKAPSPPPLSHVWHTGVSTNASVPVLHCSGSGNSSLAMEFVSNEPLTRFPVRLPQKATQKSRPAPAMAHPSRPLMSSIPARGVRSKSCRRTFDVGGAQRRCMAACSLAFEAV